MAQAFDIPTFPVDTHIHRLMYLGVLRMGKMLFKQKKMPNDCSQRRLEMIFIYKLSGMEEYSPARGWDLEKDIITKK